MTALHLELPPEISPEDAKVLLAIKLWKIGRLSLGQAAAVAGYSKRTFMEILGKQGVPIFDYNSEELMVEQGI
jgi:predicted HTH domain antitoxin